MKFIDFAISMIPFSWEGRELQQWLFYLYDYFIVIDTINFGKSKSKYMLDHALG